MYQGLNTGGALFLSEKLQTADQKTEKLFTELYYDFKRKNKYTELEIKQKETALKNILKPLTLKQYITFLEDTGFAVHIIYKHFNFVTLMALK